MTAGERIITSSQWFVVEFHCCVRIAIHGKVYDVTTYLKKHPGIVQFLFTYTLPSSRPSLGDVLSASGCVDLRPIGTTRLIE